MPRGCVPAARDTGDHEHASPRAKNGPPLAGHGAEAVRDAIASTIVTLPEQLRRSLTWDQGVELAQHAQLRVDTGLPIYFCDPHSPWQRGTNENTNGLLRPYSPKGTDLSRYSVNELAAVAATLNSRPRKRLDGEHRRRPSTISYDRFNSVQTLLRRCLESAQCVSAAY
jgi:IS30 family transposase